MVESDVEAEAQDDTMDEGEGELEVEDENPEAVVEEGEGFQPLPTPPRPGLHRVVVRGGTHCWSLSEAH